MSKNKKINTVHTKFSYFVVLLAIGIQLWLYISHPFENFGQLAMIEVIMAFIGFLFIDTIRNQRFVISPKKLNFKPFTQKIKGEEVNSFWRAILILIVILVIQIFFQFIPLTVKDYELRLAIVFASPCEEIFFRGFILEIFIRIGKKSRKRNKNTFNQKISITKDRSTNLIEILGIIFSGILFAFFHVNYYGNIRIMYAVFFGGILLSFMYVYYKDLTALIIAHFSLNILVLFQSFFIIGGL